MAIETICALLSGGNDASCLAPARKYHQQAVLINKSDIDPATVTISSPAGVTCNYNVEFSLKAGKTGYKFLGPAAGSNFLGSYDKSRSDLGFPQYKQNAQILIAGVTEAAKCILDSLDKGSFVVALQLLDGTVEIYGIGNGLTTGDYTYDIQGGGGGTPVLLSSLDDAPENYLPFVYNPGVGGDANADFDDNFNNPI